MQHIIKDHANKELAKFQNFFHQLLNFQLQQNNPQEKKARKMEKVINFDLGRLNGCDWRVLRNIDGRDLWREKEAKLRKTRRRFLARRADNYEGMDRRIWDVGRPWLPESDFCFAGESVSEFFFFLTKSVSELKLRSLFITDY